MSQEIKDKQKMINTCQAILESCAKPFVWEEQDTYEHESYKKPFNLCLPHPQIEKELLALFEKFSGSKYLYDQVLATCTLEEQWFEEGTYGLDRNINIYFTKYLLKPEYVKEVQEYFSKRLQELQAE